MSISPSGIPDSQAAGKSTEFASCRSPERRILPKEPDIRPARREQVAANLEMPGFFGTSFFESKPKTMDEARQRVVESFNSAKDEFKSKNGIKIYLSHGLSEAYAKDLMDGASTSQIKRAIKGSVENGLNCCRNKVAPTEKQADMINEANTRLARYFSGQGLDYEVPDLALIPLDMLPKNSRGAYLETLDMVFVPSVVPNNDLFKLSVIHESIHKNAAGFGVKALDEGFTEYFRIRMMLQENNIGLSSYRDVVQYALEELRSFGEKGISFAAYADELIAVSMLADKTGFKALRKAFLQGDDSQVVSAIGKEKWQKIIGLAAEYNGKNGEEYVINMEQLLPPID